MKVKLTKVVIFFKLELLHSFLYMEIRIRAQPQRWNSNKRPKHDRGRL